MECRIFLKCGLSWFWSGGVCWMKGLSIFCILQFRSENKNLTQKRRKKADKTPTICCSRAVENVNLYQTFCCSVYHLHVNVHGSSMLQSFMIYTLQSTFSKNASWSINLAQPSVKVQARTRNECNINNWRRFQHKNFIFRGKENNHEFFLCKGQEHYIFNQIHI